MNVYIVVNTAFKPARCSLLLFSLASVDAVSFVDPYLIQHWTKNKAPISTSYLYCYTAN